MRFDVALRVSPRFRIREYSQPRGITHAELARDLQDLVAQMKRVGGETRALLRLIAELQSLAVPHPAIAAVANAIAGQAARIVDAAAGRPGD